MPMNFDDALDVIPGALCRVADVIDDCDEFEDDLNVAFDMPFPELAHPELCARMFE